MPEMSLEEQALRHADEFFTGPEKWSPKGYGRLGVDRCVGAAILDAWREVSGDNRHFSSSWISPMLGLNSSVGYWNDYHCPDFAALKAKLQERILLYQKQRLSQSYIVVIGPGRRVMK